MTKFVPPHDWQTDKSDELLDPIYIDANDWEAGIKYCFKKGSPKIPPSPDPATVADAQSAASIAAAQESAKLNQINEITPYGTSTYSGEIGSPDRTKITTLDPQQQQILDYQRQVALSLAEPTLAKAGQITTDPFSLSELERLPGYNELISGAQPVEQATYDRAINLMSPEFDDRRASLENSLITRGIPVASENWDKEISRFEREKDRAYGDAANAAVGAGRAEQSRLFGLSQAAMNQEINNMMTERFTPINELAAALQGSPAMPIPQFQGSGQYGVQPTDMLGAYGLKSSQDIAQAQAKAQAQQAAMSGATGLGSTAILALALSNEKFKDVGEEVNPSDASAAIESLPISSWKYKGDDTTHIGPMANDMADRGIGDGMVMHGMDIMGLSLSAIKDLSNRLKKLEGRT